MEPLDTFLMGESELTLDSTDLECSMPTDPLLPCTDVLGDTIVDIYLLLGEHLDTLSTGDKEVDFNPSRDIEELERLLAEFSNPRFDFNDDYNLWYDNPLFDEEFEDIIGGKDEGDGDPFFWFSSYAITPSCCMLTYEGDVLLLPSSPHIGTPFDVEDLRACFRSSNHAVSDHLHIYILGICAVVAVCEDLIYRALSWKLCAVTVRYCWVGGVYIKPESGDSVRPSGSHFLRVGIPSGESKVHIEVLLVLWGNRLPIPDGSLPLSM
ncbi:hypothetical protein Tco_1263372 [Tanacetum coccineum]